MAIDHALLQRIQARADSDDWMVREEAASMIKEINDRMNTQMKEMGVQEYFEFTKDLPRYV